MTMSTRLITQAIRKAFLANAKIEYVLLFGSAAKNKLRKQSDIDIFVGGRLPFSQRAKIMGDLQKACKRDVDIVLSDDATYDVALDAYANGVRVLVNDNEQLKKDYFKHYYASEDALYLRKIKAEKLKRVFRG